jgi:hypothetical protein
MNVSEPEADAEYSRAPAASDGVDRPSAGGPRGGFGGIRVPVLAGALAAAVLLFVAEFLPLFEVRTSARNGVVMTVQSGSHHAYALLPIALLAAGLALAWRRAPTRLAVLAIAVLGIAALVIALGRDLPDAQSNGIERSGGTYVTAAASPRAGLYLETAGAVVLLITSAGGLILFPATPWTNGRVQTISSRRRSAS